jgi:hypothetical protein
MDFKSTQFINKKLNKKRLKMEKFKKGIILGLIIGLIIGGVGGYFIHNFLSRSFISGRGNFQIDENTKNEITSFFDSTSDINEINSYCGQNRMYCAYYCRNINSDNEFCSIIMNSSRIGGRQWNP